MNATLRQRLAPLASLRLTVVLMALSTVLIFASTWALIDRGIAAVVAAYYRSFIVWIEFQIFLPRDWEVPGALPWPGGYCIGALLVINLLAAHAVRFQITWKRCGILLIHGAIFLFLVGEAVTSLFALESQMPMYEGETLHWSQDIRAVEFAVVDHRDPTHDVATVIPQTRLRAAAQDGQPIRDTQLPFNVEVARWVDNARLYPSRPMAENNPATRGLGLSTTAEALPEASGVEGGGVNLPAAWVTLSHEGDPLGTYLISPLLQPDNQPYKLLGQNVLVGKKTYTLYLRFQRHYHPFAITLAEFRHDKYTGSNVARNFSSDVTIQDTASGAKRKAHIAMNEPLRYRSATFYQSGYIPPDRGTVLQVMRNPGMPIPYIAFALAGVGLVLHFGLMLARYARRQNRQAKSAADMLPRVGSAGHYVAWAAPLIAVAAVIVTASPHSIDSPYDLDTYATLPVSYKGRVKPMDTVARNMLLMLSGRQRLEHEEAVISPTQWLADVLSDRQVAQQYAVFRVSHPQVRSLLEIDAATGKRLTYDQISPHLGTLFREARRADKVSKRHRDSYDVKVLELANRVSIYRGIWSHNDLYVVPPTAKGEDWKTMVDADHREAPPDPRILSYARMRQAYGQQNLDRFNQAVLDHANRLRADVPRAAKLAEFETRFNAYAPFALAQMLYLVVLLLTMGAWFGATRPLAAAAYRILLVTFLLHSAGLVARIVLSGRPPVTNLYSSAIFIGWGCILFCLIMERAHRTGLLTLIGGAAGFLTLLVAAALAGDGDTMAVLVAVLDTNFWLATHVVIVTLGYSATFLAGMLATAYIFGGLFTPLITPAVAQRLGQMLYGVIAFALVFSLVGTVLGGIWADQSWGRFWGWDPKENGALLIVLWNAMILHARWAGLARTRGIAGMAVFGNIVTSWSWWGTNMLGVGLHSYGFIDSAVLWLGIFIASQLGIIAVASIPVRHWRSVGVRPRAGDSMTGPPNPPPPLACS